jgi:hypothetical protein
MQPVDIESAMGLDRIATWNEIISAMSVSSPSGFAFFGACDELSEMDSDVSGSACNLPEDAMWLAIVSEMPDSNSNEMSFAEGFPQASKCGRGYV